MKRKVNTSGFCAQCAAATATSPPKATPPKKAAAKKKATPKKKAAKKKAATKKTATPAPLKPKGGTSANMNTFTPIFAAGFVGLICVITGMILMNGINIKKGEKAKQEQALREAKAEAQDYKTRLQDLQQASKKPIDFTIRYEEQDGETKIQEAAPIMVIKSEDADGFPFWIEFYPSRTTCHGDPNAAERFLHENLSGLKTLREHIAENGSFEWNNMNPDEETLVEAAGLGGFKVYTP